jgi:hypothetical protein
MPSVEIGACDRAGNGIDKLTISVGRFGPLTQIEVAQLVHQAGVLYPRAVEFKNEPPLSGIRDRVEAERIFQTWRLPSNEDVKRYVETEYPNWFVSVAKVFPAAKSQSLIVESIEPVSICGSAS